MEWWSSDSSPVCWKRLENNWRFRPVRRSSQLRQNFVPSTWIPHKDKRQLPPPLSVKKCIKTCNQERMMIIWIRLINAYLNQSIRNVFGRKLLEKKKLILRIYYEKVITLSLNICVSNLDSVSAVFLVGQHIFHGLEVVFIFGKTAFLVRFLYQQDHPVDHY